MSIYFNILSNNSTFGQLNVSFCMLYISKSKTKIIQTSRTSRPNLRKRPLNFLIVFNTRDELTFIEKRASKVILVSNYI